MSDNKDLFFVDDDEDVDLFTAEPEKLDVGKAKKPLNLILPVVSFVLLLTAILFLTVFFYQQSENLIVKKELEDLRHSEKLIHSIINQFYKKINKDIVLLGKTGGDKFSAYKTKNKLRENNVNILFVDYLKNNEFYNRLTVYDFYKNPLFNVNRKFDSVHESFAEGANSLSDDERQYDALAIAASLKYADGEVYFSDIIKQGGEKGKISMLVATTIRSQAEAAKPVVLVASINVEKFIRKTIIKNLSGIDFHLLGHDGIGLLNKNGESFWRGDNTKFSNMEGVFSELWDVVDQNKSHYYLDPKKSKSVTHPGFYSLVNLSHYGAEQPLRLLLLYDNKKYFNELKVLRYRLIIIGILLAIAALIISFYIAKRLLQPLQQMSAAIIDYEDVDSIKHLPTTAQDETGVLARSFYNLFKNKEERELELVRTRHYMEGITNKAPVLLAYVDKYQTYQFANHCYERWSGIPLSNLIGLCMEDVINKEGYQLVKPYIDQALKGETVGFETEIAYGSGDMKHVYCTYTPEEDETGVQGFYICVEDLTQNKKSNLEIQELSSRLDFALEAPGIGVWDYNLVSGELLWDERMYHIYHAAEKDFSGAYAAWSSRVHPDDITIVNELIEESVNTGEDFVTEFRVVWPNQQERWVAAHGRVIKNELGQSIRMIGTNVDITARKQLALEREEALAKAEESAKLKSEFLASMSHEIRTPMNGVLGMLGLLQRTRLNNQQTHYIKLAHTSAESLLTLINDILDFSKVEAGKMELDIIHFHLPNMLGDFTEAMAQRAQEKHLELVLDTTGVHTTMVQGDPGRVRQILTNLVGNAIKFTSQGEVVIRASLHEHHHGGLAFECSVSDTGIGIPSEKMDVLFDSFSQVDASTTRKYGGTGLGLAIAKQLCKLMNGDINVSSNLGGGSTFTFSIELQVSENTVAALPEVDITGTDILIVDDNETNRQVLKDQLALWGAKVTEAKNGQEALTLLNDNTNGLHKIAIIDMQMPEMDGQQLGKEIRKDSRFDDMHMVMMTSMSQRGDAKKFAEVGFSAFFPKPTTMNDLFKALNVLIHGGEALESASPLVTRHHLKSLDGDISTAKEIQTVAVSEVQEETTPVPGESCTTESSTARLLLVEDNIINQEVAKGILAGLGYSADVANNGLEAISALNNSPKSAPYDLILMDCQMPEMDGYEATHAIRSGRARDPNIPIIAMTANAMKGDKEKCLAAGMSDYLSKPIDPEKLNTCLQQWLRVKAGHSITKEEEVMSDEHDAIWDKEGFMRRIMNNETIANKLIDLFKSDTPKTIAELEDAISGDKVEEAGLLAHKLKGSVGNLGGIELAALAQKIELAGKGSDLNEVKALWPDVKPKYDELLNRIESR
ncbi:MAG: response regulator [Cellvibrionaceae bacterium]